MCALNHHAVRVFVESLVRLMEHNMRTETPDETRLPGSDEELSWRNWVLAQFNSYVYRLTPSHNLNLVAGTFSNKVSARSDCQR